MKPAVRLAKLQGEILAMEVKLGHAKLHGVNVHNLPGQLAELKALVAEIKVAVNAKH
jgi:hypothetical protein